jgi:hypothetical protein
MTQEIYERTMRRLRVTIPLLTVALLSLIARSVVSGLKIADVISEMVIALLLTASVGLWRQGRRLRTHAGIRQGGTDDETARACAPARGQLS